MEASGITVNAAAKVTINASTAEVSAGMLTVNAGNIDKDWEWVTTHAAGARWRNISADTGLVAVQGPKAEALLGALAERDVTAIGYYRFVHGTVAGVHTLISRTGYTGEDGFELYVAAGDTPRLAADLFLRQAYLWLDRPDDFADVSSRIESNPVRSRFLPAEGVEQLVEELR
jgi:glycine cleavage system aminomethyltransferase T